MRVVNLYRDFGICGYNLKYTKTNDKAKQVISDYMNRINIRQFMKDAIHELALTGNVVCYDRDGQAIDIYPINVITVFPLVKDGQCLVGYNISEINDYFETYGKGIDEYLEGAYPKEIIQAQKNGNDYAMLNEQNTFFKKINSSRYERYGTSILLPAFEDIAHKNLLKSVEKSISNSIIDKILLIQVGDNEVKPSQKLINQYASAFNNVGYGATVVVPYYVNASFVEPDISGLNTDKFVEVDKDILNALGISVSLLRGEGQGSYSDGLVNFTGITTSIENCREPIAEIVNGLFKNELARNGISIEYAPTIEFDDVVIDENSIASIVSKMFTEAGMPFETYYQALGYDYEQIKALRIKENEEKVEEIFKPRQTAYTMSYNDNLVDTGRPQENLSERQTDPNQSNNKQIRPNVKGKMGIK